MTFNCEEKGGSTAVEIIVRYDGGDEGSVTLSGPFGDATLPASKTSGKNGLGAPQTIIRAFGEANLLLPDKAALETCIKSAAPDGDKDFESVALLSCKWSTPVATTPVAATAGVNLLIAEEGVMAELKRTYAEPSALALTSLSIEAFPPMDCTQSGK